MSWLTATYFLCSSDDSDDSDGALGTGLSMDPSATQHTALTVKSEPCEQEDCLSEGKPLNGILLQGKGKIHTATLIFMLHTCYYTASLVSFSCDTSGRYSSCTSIL